jgi:ABC-2 type transport system permease protein
MAVYKRTYKSYSGPITPAWSRWTIITRFSYQRLVGTKINLFMLASLIFPLGCAVYIYLVHNASVLKSLGPNFSNFLSIDSKFFLTFCGFQSGMAYLLVTFIGPALISPDVVNNAMPLYLCRPLTRTEYVIGKMAVLMSLLSVITWIPGLILFGLQASLAGWEWTRANLWIAAAVFLAPLMSIVMLSLIAMAASAWVKWRAAAGALILGVFFLGAGFGSVINAVLRTHYGSLINLSQVLNTVWAGLFRQQLDTGLEPLDAWNALAVACIICLWLLAKKVRAFEVVK